MHQEPLIERGITSDVIGAFFEVYNSLGFGFLEFVYSLALEEELLKKNRTVGREVNVPVLYKGKVLTTQRVDMIVDDKVLIEIKSTPVLPPMARRQTPNYLRVTTLEVALLLHFGQKQSFTELSIRRAANSPVHGEIGVIREIPFEVFNFGAETENRV
jgi:GxxExxY protein